MWHKTHEETADPRKEVVDSSDLVVVIVDIFIIVSLCVICVCKKRLVYAIVYNDALLESIDSDFLKTLWDRKKEKNIENSPKKEKKIHEKSRKATTFLLLIRYFFLLLLKSDDDERRSKSSSRARERVRRVDRDAE